MAYVRLNRYQLELVQSVRVKGKPRTVVLHRFNSAEELVQLEDPKVKRRLEKKARGKIDARVLIERGQALVAGGHSDRLTSAKELEAGRSPSRISTCSMQTTSIEIEPGGSTLQTLPLKLPPGALAPALWKQYEGFRALLDGRSYSQAIVSMYEFSFLYGYRVEPCVYRNQAMLKVHNTSSARVIFPVSVLLSILRHGAAITKIMFTAHDGGGECFWEDQGVSCKSFSGVWLSVGELDELGRASVSLQEFAVQLSAMSEWLKEQESVAWIQEALAKVVKGRMRRETLQERLVAAGAPEAGAVSWLVWEKAIYVLGPMKARPRSKHVHAASPHLPARLSGELPDAFKHQALEPWLSKFMHEHWKEHIERKEQGSRAPKPRIAKPKLSYFEHEFNPEHGAPHTDDQFLGYLRQVRRVHVPTLGHLDEEWFRAYEERLKQTYVKGPEFSEQRIKRAREAYAAFLEWMKKRASQRFLT